MGIRIIKLPDVGEGVAEAELVEWHVKVGDVVAEDQSLGAVMTEKATVEIPAPFAGTIVALGAEVGGVVAVGAELVRIEIADAPNDKAGDDKAGDDAATVATPKLVATHRASEKTAPTRPPAPEAAARLPFGTPRPPGEKPIASPAVRRRAREAGIDLRQVRGTGPAGRIGHDDLDLFMRGAPATAAPAVRMPNPAVETVKVIGMRRLIAQRMAESKRRAAHFAYVEEVDVTALEDLRARLNDNDSHGRGRLTLMPFLMLAVVRAVAEFPQMNALYDDEAETVERHGGVHIGIATQTPSGLMVPVVRHAEARGLWDCAAEVRRLAEAAREGQARREELSGSTITITSLGPLGGIVTTPVINRPEVAIIGVNKQVVRPVWQGGQFVPRKMMNLSSSFDHRVIDGYDAARFIQRIRLLLEQPATIFIEA